MKSDREVGQKIINAIVSGALLEVKESGPGGSLIVWRQNADEQIGRVALAAAAERVARSQIDPLLDLESDGRPLFGLVAARPLWIDPEFRKYITDMCDIGSINAYASGYDARCWDEMIGVRHAR